MVRGDRSSARQLILDLGRAPSYDPDDFLVSASNAVAHGLVERWPDWPTRMLLLVGPAGSGKSHLAAMWAERSGARLVHAGESVDDLLEADTVIAVLEDIDRASRPEAQLFHLINRTHERGGWLVATARRSPDTWGLRTPDLVSRLRLASVAPIERPDSMLIRSVIIKLFADRQILIADDVVAYAALHCEQSLDAISLFVASVDEEALALNRRITRQLAAQTLTRLSETASDAED